MLLACFTALLVALNAPSLCHFGAMDSVDPLLRVARLFFDVLFVLNIVGDH
jgi:hypothetical protein